MWRVPFELVTQYLVLSSHPTSISCDIEKGFITYSATLTVLVLACECIPLSHPPSLIYVCVCFSNLKKKKKLYTCKKQKNSWLILSFSLWLGSLYIANRACLRFNFIHSDSSIRKTVYLLCFFLEREREKE